LVATTQPLIFPISPILLTLSPLPHSHPPSPIFLSFLQLAKRKHQLGETLSGGEQQMLAISRALLSKPKLLLLDEPSLGLAPIIVKNIFQIIVDINKQGTTILLVEQNAHLALSIAHRGYVMETGKITLEDDAKALLNNEQVKNAYLGG
jgi:branched-chain amino acid transport system ATP-binding protein